MERITLPASLSKRSIFMQLKCIIVNVFFMLIATVSAAQDSLRMPLRKGNIGGYMITRLEKVDQSTTKLHLC